MSGIQGGYRPYQRIAKLQTVAATANESFFTFQSQQNDVATLQIKLSASGVLSLAATPEGGSADTGTILSGTTIPANEWQTVQFAIDPLGTYALSASASCNVTFSMLGGQ